MKITGESSYLGISESCPVFCDPSLHPPLAMCVYSCATLTQNSQINNDNNKPAECDKTSIAHFGTVSVVDTVQRFFLSFSAAAAAVATSCNPRFRFRNSRRSFFYII